MHKSFFTTINVNLKNVKNLKNVNVNLNLNLNLNKNKNKNFSLDVYIKMYKTYKKRKSKYLRKSLKKKVLKNKINITNFDAAKVHPASFS